MRERNPASDRPGPAFSTLWVLFSMRRMRRAQKIDSEKQAMK
jgi:hypothetical protein